MSRSYPIISITGSSGAGTTSVKKTFENIFRREKVAAAYVEGDAFHRYNRIEMRTKMAEEAERDNKHFSHFSPETATTASPGPEPSGTMSTIMTRPNSMAQIRAHSPNGRRCPKNRICCSMKVCMALS